MSATPSSVAITPDMLREYRALLQFIHLAPVGLVQMKHSGDITMMNPMATQLLAPLGFGDGGDLNLLTLFDTVTPDLRLMVQGFSRVTGVLCDKHLVHMPETDASLTADAPLALGVTAVQLQADPDTLMVVLTDESSAIKLQRIRATWGR
jgi:hypothetical protein